VRGKFQGLVDGLLGGADLLVARVGGVSVDLGDVRFGEADQRRNIFIIET